MKKHSAKTSAALLIIPALAVSTAVQAQIEEIVVTAQKREQNLQETPISISAYSAQDIERLDITDVHSISTGTPNLYVNLSQGDSTTAVFSMRGVAQPNASNLANEGTVGLYFDGIYIGKGTAAVFDLADIERVEVLRGPQGTLYGKNTIGGAINIISARPTGEFGGNARVGFGTDSLLYSRLNLDLPAVGSVGEGLGELAAKLSLVTRNRDGLVPNRDRSLSPVGRSGATSADFGEQDMRSGRLALAWQPTDKVAVDYAYDASRVRNTTPFFQLLELEDTSIFNPGASAAGFGYYNYLEPDYPDWGTTDFGNRDHADIDGHTLTVEWQLSDVITVRSLTGYREFDTEAMTDYDGSNLSFYHVQRNVDYRQKSQEFQLLGDHGNLNWVAGVYYFNEDGTYYSPRAVFGEFSGNNLVYSVAELDNDLKAIFGQVDWSPAALPDLTFSVGARYSEETKDMYRAFGDFTNQSPAQYPIPPTHLPSLDLASNTSVMGSVTWNATDDITLYVKYAEGYRSGGYDGQTTSPAVFAIPYESEELAAYEVGFKTRWLDDRVQLNGAWFFSDYDELQITVFDASRGSSFVDNAGKAEIKGLELELRIEPSDNLAITAGFGFLDPTFKRYDYVEGEVLTNIAGVAKFTHTPERSYSAAVDYRAATTDIGAFDIHLDYSYVGAHYVHPHLDGKTPPGKIQSYGLLNARLSLAEIPIGGGFDSLTFTLWGKNITDKEYITTNIPFGNAYFLAGSYGEPRTYGAEISVRF